MNHKSSKPTIIHLLFGGFIALCLLLPAMAQAVQLTNDGNNHYNPVAARDAAGNVHLATSPGQSANIYYSMVAADGTTLIAPTQISASADTNQQRPAIAVTSTGKVIVIWQIGGGIPELYFVQIDPSLHAQDGTTANPATIKTVADTLISGADGVSSGHVSITLDTADNIHAIWEERCGNSVWYSKLDSSGGSLIAPVNIGANNDCHATPDIVVDTNGNAHVVWSDNNTATGNIHYMMINGTTGAAMIDDTDLGVSLGKITSISVDGSGHVYIVWAKHGDNNTALSNQSVAYAIKLNPGLHAQDGSAAAPASSIVVVGETAIPSSNPGTTYSYYPDSSLGVDSRLHVTWNENGGCSTGDLWHARLSTANLSVLSSNQLSSTAALHSCRTYGTVFPTGIVWSDDPGATGTDNIFAVAIAAPPSGPIPDDDPLCGNLIPTGKQSPWTLAILGMLMLGVWVSRRRA